MRRFFTFLPLLVALAVSAPARAELVRNGFEGVRPTGMGGAFLAVSDDSNLFWYNPAGLARVRGGHFNLFDFTLGVDSRDTLSRIGDAVFDGRYDRLLRNDTEFLRFSVRPTLMMPYFGLTLYDNVQGFFDLQNLDSLDATVDVFSVNDLGVAGALAIPMSEYASIGATVRAFQRTSADFRFTALDLLTQLGLGALADIQTAIYDRMKSLAGTGLGLALDLGGMLTIPLPKDYPKVTFAAVMNDVGMTTYRPIGQAFAPAPTQAKVHFGSSLTYDLAKQSKLRFALDVRNAFEPLPFIKTLHVGAEYKLPWMGLRAGLYQGNLTAGFSLEFPPHTRVHLSTYAPELGRTLGERNQRWYLLQFIVGFNPL